MFFFLSFFSWLSDPFFNALSFLYILLPSSYLHHLISPNLPPFMTFVTFYIKEDGGRNLLSCGLHCSGHFFINAADKAIVYYLMWMQHATPNHKLPYCPLTSTLFRLQLPLRILQSTVIHFFPSSGGFLPQAHGL